MIATFGRERERRRIDELLASQAAGSGGVLYLEGEAGIGKTHLVRWLLSRIGQESRVVMTSADELERDRPGRLLLQLGDSLGLPPGWSTAGSAEGAPPLGFAIIEAVVNALEDVAAKGPITIVAEDLHWADDLSLRGLAAIARRVGPVPVVLVATARPAPSLRGLVTFLANLPPGSRHGVGGLEMEEVLQLATSVAGAPPGRTLMDQLDGASGNPLLLSEWLRALRDDGALVVAAGTASATSTGIPLRLRDLVLRQVAQIAGPAVHLLRLASLLGEEFALMDVALVANEPVSAVANQLQEAVAAGLLSGSGELLAFRHDLVRQTIAEAMAPAIRRDLHIAAGRAMAANGYPASRVARQLLLGARKGDRDAVEWLERAGNEALVTDPGAAVVLMEQALGLAADSWSGRTRIETALIEPLSMCGRIDDALRLARTLLDRTTRDDERLAIRRGIAGILAAIGDLGAVSRECEMAADLPSAPADEREILRCVAASTGLFVGRPSHEVGDIARAAVRRTAETGDTRFACWGEQALGLVALAEGFYDEALVHTRASRELLELRPTPLVGFLIPRIWEGSSLFYLDRFEEAAMSYQASTSLAEARGEVAPLLLTYTGMVGMNFVAGHLQDSLAAIDTVLALAMETGAQPQHLVCHGVSALIAVLRGDIATARHHVRLGEDVIADGHNHLFGIDLLFWASAEVLEKDGNRPAALALLAQTWQQIASVRFLLQARSLGPNLVRLACAEGDFTLARSVATDMEVGAGRTTAGSAAAAALFCRGLAETDVALLTASVDRYRSTPRRLDLALASEETSRVLFAAGRAQEAVALGEEAASMYIEMGADGSTARVDGLLRAQGVRRRRHGPSRAVTGWDALSKSELAVVRLVAEGLSNPQIGQRLYISRRTVETHVAHIFRKLDLSNRAQLAALATAHPPGH